MFGIWLMAAWPDDPPGEAEGDAALVAQAQSGDVKAFAALHARHYGRIYHLAYLKTNHAQDSEDIASETFARALAALPRFRLSEGTRSLYPWLHRITMNLIADSARQRPPSGVFSLDAPTIAGVRALLDTQESDPEFSPPAVAERHEVQQLVRSAIDSLPPDQGDVLVYRFLGDLSAREIAPLLGRSEAAVKSLLHRAVVSLRRELAQRLETVERLETSRIPSAKNTHSEETQSVGRT